MKLLLGATRKHPIKLFVLLMALVFFFWGGMNTTGFCWAKKDWLTADEFKYIYIEKVFRVSRAQAIELANEAPKCCGVLVVKGPKINFSGVLGRARADIIVYTKGQYHSLSLFKENMTSDHVDMTETAMSNCGAVENYEEMSDADYVMPSLYLR